MDVESLTVETDLLHHREAKPHFISPCCFGEDFARWLRQRVADLAAAAFGLCEPIQEDYGWGFWATRGPDPFWIALSFCGERPTEGPAQWVVSVAYDPGLNLLKGRTSRRLRGCGRACGRSSHPPRHPGAR